MLKKSVFLKTAKILARDYVPAFGTGTKVPEILDDRNALILHRKQREAGRDQTRTGSDVCRSARKSHHADGSGPLLLLCPVFLPSSHLLVRNSCLLAGAGSLQSSSDHDGKFLASRQ